uniref:Uncharacterized protein n=1 Tax=viral metagenome TaxID=1070528 RepID=A0A6M3Y4L2_9ZZZZ
MEDIKNTAIKITEVADKGERLEVIDGRTKYGFWKAKKDGTKTKAYEQWLSFELGVGKSVNAGVKEEDASFTGKEGNEVNFTRRTIMFFNGDEHGVPYQTDVSSLTASQAILLDEAIARDVAIAQAIEAHERDYHSKAEISPDDVPF